MEGYFFDDTKVSDKRALNVHDLDEVLRAQASRLTTLERLLSRQRDEIRDLSQSVSEPRRLEDDKPPHY